MIDNSYVITKEGCIGVIIGNRHLKKGFFGLISYIPKNFFLKDCIRIMLGKEYIKVSDLYIKNWKKYKYDKAQKLISKLFPQYNYKDSF